MDTNTRVGDYEILGELGTGGMGRVYRVRNVVSDRIEAMKILLPDLVGRQNLADRFLREIKLLAALSHPNIASLRTAHVLDNQFVMIMEFVEGQSLATRLEHGPIAPADALTYVDQVLDALTYAHEHEVVHRDIKPANMMLTPDGVVKLMDFGIARSPGDQTLTMTGMTTGSLAYMSPEQVKGAPTDARSDVYSLGVSLYEMVTGRRPFMADSTFGVMTAHLEETPTPPIALQPQLPQAVNDLILTAIAKDPAQRFQTAAAFRDAVNGARGTARAPRTGSSVRMQTLVDTAVPAAILEKGTASATRLPQAASKPSPVGSDHARTLMDTPSSPLLQSPRTGATPSASVPASRRMYPAIYMAAGALLVIGAAASLAYFGRNATAAPRPVVEKTEASAPSPAAASGTPTATTPATASADPTPSTSVATTPSATPLSPTTATPPTDPVVAPAPSTTPATRVATSTSPQVSSVPVVTGTANQPVRGPVAAPSTKARAGVDGRRAAPGVGSDTAVHPGAAPAQAPPAPTGAQAAPAPVEASAADFDRLEDDIDQLSIKAGAVNGSLDRLQQEQARQGLGLRRDMAARQQSMNLNLAKAREAFEQRNATRAKRYSDLAQDDIEALEKFLGR